ncbi:MAG: CDP-alcohol phosphatidyltransferase family protein, partial [Deltaproteobacteria bacterium]|nr:CDP-alcohol phosphatidyltransferase family protein [Deltaproteobacteria bacterium]
MPSSPTDSAPRAWIVHAESSAETTIWGLTPEERLQRSLRIAGCAEITSSRVGEPFRAPASGSVVILRGDALFDPRVIEALIAAPGTLLLAPWSDASGSGTPVAAHVDATRFDEARAWLAAPDDDGKTRLPGLPRVCPADITPAYIASLRKAEAPYVLPARPETAAEIERQLFGAAYKSVTDLITKWAWPAPTAAVVRVLAQRRVHPNVVTIASWLLAIAALLLFAEGHFGLGLLAAWAMTFLDTVDGKLARVTLTSSPIGNVLDHSLDLIHPPFWYLAWGVGAAGLVDTATWIVVGGYLAGRLLEGVFMLAFSLETHCWRPIDTLFRTITARRNPNLILLTVAVLAGAPELGMPMVAIWTVASITFHCVRLTQA